MYANYVVKFGITMTCKHWHTSSGCSLVIKLCHTRSIHPSFCLLEPIHHVCLSYSPCSVIMAFEGFQT